MADDRQKPEAPRRSAPPLGILKYLYLGSAKFNEDLAYYRDILGARVLWNKRAFGARVASLVVADGPQLLIADHRPSPGCMPVFCVPDLDETAADLAVRGWKPTTGPFEIPDGPCYVFTDPSGNELAIFGNTRPDAMLSVGKTGDTNRKSHAASADRA